MASDTEGNSNSNCWISRRSEWPTHHLDNAHRVAGLISRRKANTDLETRVLRRRFSATRVRKLGWGIAAAAAAISDHAAAIVLLFPWIKASR